KKRGLGICTALLLLPACASAVVIADLTTDWSTTVNGTNGWTYNAGNRGMPLLLNWPLAPGIPTWGLSNSPGMLKSPGFEQQGGLDLNLNDIAIYSTSAADAANNGIANVKWVSNVAGTITISGSVWAANLGQPVDAVYTLKCK